MEDIGAPPEVGFASVLAAMVAVKMYFKGIQRLADAEDVPESSGGKRKDQLTKAQKTMQLRLLTSKSLSWEPCVTSSCKEEQELCQNKAIARNRGHMY